MPRRGPNPNRPISEFPEPEPILSSQAAGDVPQRLLHGGEFGRGARRVRDRRIHRAGAVDQQLGIECRIAGRRPRHGQRDPRAHRRRCRAAGAARLPRSRSGSAGRAAAARDHPPASRRAARAVPVSVTISKSASCTTSPVTRSSLSAEWRAAIDLAHGGRNAQAQDIAIGGQRHGASDLGHPRSPGPAGYGRHSAYARRAAFPRAAPRSCPGRSPPRKSRAQRRGAWAMPVTMRVPIRADRCSSVAGTGTGKVMVASIDCASSLRKRRSVVTVAKPPRTRTDMRCRSVAGAGRCRRCARRP